MAQGKDIQASKDTFTFQCKLSAKGKLLRKEEEGPLGKSVLDYSYDNAGHLTEVRRNGKLSEKYVYDDEGRRVEDYRSWSGASRQFIYGYDGALIRLDDAFFEWTPTGQLKAVSSQAERVEYEYGDDTRLDQVYLPSGPVVQYKYGNELMPVEVLESRKPVYRYEWQNGLLLRRCVDILNGVTYDFAYGNARIPESVSISAAPEAMRRLTGVFSPKLKLRVWADQVDSIRVLSTADGQILKTLEYDSFGNITHETRPEWNFPLGFAGGLHDAYTGFVRFGFRDYAPQTGRFTAKDPIGDTGGDHDLWDYCVDDPIGNSDRLGLKTVPVPEKISTGTQAGLLRYIGEKIAFGIAKPFIWISGHAADGAQYVFTGKNEGKGSAGAAEALTLLNDYDKIKDEASKKAKKQILDKIQKK